MKAFASATIIAILLIGCTKDTGTGPEPMPPPVSKAGRFGVALMNGLHKTAGVDTGSVVTFQLGDLLTSRTVYFLLTNAGQNPIVGITLTASDPALSLTPSTINELDPASSSSSVVPIVNLGIQHGKAINALGFAPTLPAGPFTGEFTITGRTFNGTDSVTVSMTVKVNAVAKVLNITITNSVGEIDLTDFDVSGTPNNGPMRRYFSPTDSVVSWKNTGNVPITVNEYNSNAFYAGTFVRTFTLAVGDSIQITLPAQFYGSPVGWFAIDGGGATPNPSRYVPDVDGKLYIGLYNSTR